MSQASSVSAGCKVNDPFIEHLRKKYLQKHDDTSRSLLPAEPSSTTSDVESFAPMPANPSLTESERKHYNRAMKELGKAFQLSELQIKSSLVEFENGMKFSSNDASSQALIEQRNLTLSDNSIARPESAQDVAKPPEIDKTSWLASSSSEATSLPSTITEKGRTALRTKRTISTFASCEEPELNFLENISSTISGMSRHFGSNNPGKVFSMFDIKAIYSELMIIYQKLQDERGRIVRSQVLEQNLESKFEAQERELVIREAFLLEKEKELLDREHALTLRLQNMKKTKEIAAKLEGVELEVQEKVDLLQQKHHMDIEQLNVTLLERTRELKRMKSSFDVLKEQNDHLKTELKGMSAECQNAKSQYSKLKKRWENLHRRQDFRACKPQNLVETSVGKSAKENVSGLCTLMPALKGPDNITSKQLSGAYDILSVAFDWISRIGFKKSTEISLRTVTESGEFVTDKCLKILPLLVDVIKILPSLSSQKRNHFSFLSFSYLCLSGIDESQHSLLSSTSRRLGDELYKPSCAFGSSQKNSSASLILATTAGSTALDRLENLGHNDKTSTERKPCGNVYFCSNNPEIRLISCLIIMTTLHQVDVLAHVFSQMKKDLKDDLTRKMFLHYNATRIILPYITYRANKALLGDAIDVLLQLSMESSLLPEFLEQCSNEQWFRAFSSALRGMTEVVDKPCPRTGLLEKLCVVLEKLSKIKGNKKYFDAFSMGRNLKDCYRRCDAKNAFLTLNLRSILFNLNLLKDSSQHST